MKKLLIVLTLVLAMLLLASCQLPNFGGNEAEEENNGVNNGQNGESNNQGGDEEQNGDPNCAHNTDKSLIISERAVKATCTKDGLTAKEYCIECGYVQTPAEVIPATGHTQVTIPATEATCMAPGATAGVKCSAFNQTLIKPVAIAQLEHVEVSSSDVPATCTASGSIGGTHCAKCYTTIKAPDQILPAFGHERGLDHIEITKEGQAPTCKDEGWTEEVYCYKCDSVIISSKTLACTDHLAEDLVTVPGYAETCVATGLTDGEYCSFCNVTTIEQAEIPVNADSHPTETLVTLDAVAVTCYADGLTEGKYCPVCENVALAQEAITDRPAHSLVEAAAAIAPDCSIEKNGCTVHLVCDVDECDYEEPAEVVEYEHVHGEWTVSIEAGVGTAGEKYTHCQECGSLITEQIPAIPEDGNDDLPEYIDPDGIV